MSDANADMSGIQNVTLKYVLVGVGIMVLLIIVIAIYRHLQNKRRKEPLLLSAPKKVNDVGVIDGLLAPLSLNGMEYTYSFWMFIQDWSTSYGVPKCVLYRSNNDVNNFEVANPSIWLYPNENKLMIRVSTYKGSQYDPSIYPEYPTNEQNLPVVNPNKWSPEDVKRLFNTQFTCDVGNIPLQKWVHVTVTCWDRTMDIYVNGKLARSCLLPGVPVFDKNILKSIYVGKGNTYNGFMSRFKYYNRAVTPAEVYNLYRSGPLPANWLWNSLKTKIQMTFNVSSGNNQIQ
jgi:hypothetical protein